MVCDIPLPLSTCLLISDLMVVAASSAVELVLELDVDATVTQDDDMLEVEGVKDWVENKVVANGDWQVDGEEWPLLQEITNKLFDMYTSSAESDRNFSTIDSIRMKLRNRLRTASVIRLFAWIFIYDRGIWGNQLWWLLHCYLGPRMEDERAS